MGMLLMRNWTCVRVCVCRGGCFGWKTRCDHSQLCDPIPGAHPCLCPQERRRLRQLRRNCLKMGIVYLCACCVALSLSVFSDDAFCYEIESGSKPITPWRSEWWLFSGDLWYSSNFRIALFCLFRAAFALMDSWCRWATVTPKWKKVLGLTKAIGIAFE